MTMKHFRTFWLLLTLMMVGSFTLTSCVDNQDNPSGGGGGGDKDKNYVERLVPVVDPQPFPRDDVSWHNDTGAELWQ